MSLAGVPLRFSDPVASAQAGLRFIHQELGLLGDMTVLENIRLGGAYTSRRHGPVRWKAEGRAVAALLERFDIPVHPSTMLSDVSPIQRTQIAIARALENSAQVRLLVPDEPTASLPNAEAEQLFRMIRRVTAEGVGVIYVSHRLQELYEIADHLTILRDGKVAGKGEPHALTKPDLIQMITGVSEATRSGPERKPAAEGSVPAQPRRRSRPTAATEPALRIDGLAGGQLQSLSLRVDPGEIVGVARLAGSGVHDLVGLLLGRTPLRAGNVEISGKKLPVLSPLTVYRNGVSVLPAGRLLKSIPSLSVRENITLPELSGFWRRGLFRHRAERLAVRELLIRYSVRPTDPERILATLSGGNQQKATVAKWMRTRPAVLVLDEPTAGVDVAGRLDILRLLVEAADEGVAVVVCSSDLDDLAEFCDRVVIVRDGHDATELRDAMINREEITAQCYGTD